MSNNNNNNNETNNNMQQQQQRRRRSANQETLGSIESALGDVEASVNAATRNGGGRSIRESIRNALGSIRSRLGTVEEAPALSTEETETMNGLEQRLRNAEMAHSNRIPLNVLQREMSRRQSARAAEVTDKKKETEEQKAPASRRRRASVLMASRRMAAAAEGHQADMDLHGATPLPVETTTEAMDESENQGVEVKMVEEQTFEPMEEDEGEDDSEELPILLTQTSFSRLDPARRSVLFGSDRRLSVQPTTSATMVYSWGSGINSLHDDSDDRKPENALIKPDSRVGARDISSASIGHYHAACSTSTGEVLVCGRNTAGAVDPDRKGDDVIARPIILESLSMSRIVQVSCGLDHTAALRSNGAVLTWGSNEFGQLGHRLPFSRDGPPPASSRKFCRPKIMALGAGRRATSVACGDCFTLVLTSRMGLLACGVEVVSGHSKKEGETHLPAFIPALEDLPLVAVAAGRRHAVAVTAHGSAFAWGENSNGCLGRAFPKSTSVPVPIRVYTEQTVSSGPGLPEPLSNWNYWNGREGRVSLADDIAVVDAACGDEHTVLVTRSGRLLVCGSNSHGQLGLDPTLMNMSNRAEPVIHPNASRSFIQAEAGEAHTLLLDDIGDVWQLGGGSISKPEQVHAKKYVGWIAAGGNHNVAIAAAVGRALPNREFSDEGGDDVAALARGRSVEDLLSVNPEGKKMKDDDEERPLGDAEIELAKRTEELLKTPAVLNSLFLDPKELEDLYEQLLSTDSLKFRQCVATAVEKGILQGLESIELDDARLLYPEQVRFLLLYIQCPLFLGWKDSDVVFDRRGDLVLLLCETILGLSYEGYKAFLSWATSIYPRELFTRLLVRPLIAQLEKCFSVSAGAERRPVPALVGVLRWLYAASERAGGIAPPEEFYCDVIGELDPRWIVEDLFSMKDASKQQRAANFFLCDNPFLFSPSTKRSLLQFESEVNMLRIATKKMTYNEEEKTYEIEPYFVLEIERENLLKQTLDKVGRAEPMDLRKKLRIVFKGEEGIDAGGVTREFFQLLSTQLFDDSSGMWSESLAAEQITWFNPDCRWSDDGYYLVGILIGLAVYNSVLLDVHFPQAIYRKLLGESLGFEDLVDVEVKNGLQLLLDYQGDDVEDIFCLTFDVSWMDLGEEKRKELKPGGSNIPVTSSNKEEYVMLYVKWLLVDSIHPQFEAFERGFMRVMEDSSLELLRPEDLELLVVGSPELDFDALEKNTEYEGGYDSESPVIRHFWHFTKNADPDTQLKLLRFTTGSAKAPIGGLGKQAFKIQKAGPDSMQLPSSHTCFNTLLLPDYGDNYEKLEERLSRAIIECEGFGLQ